MNVCLCPCLKTRLLAAVLLAAAIPARGTAADQTPELDRSPVDLALSADGGWLVSANQTSDSVSLVATGDGRVLHEIQVGRRPAAIALTPDDRTVLVSGSYSGEVTVLQVAGGRLERIGSVLVGFEPHGIAVTPDGRSAWAALAAGDRIVQIDLSRREVVAEVPVERWPRYLDIARDGKRLAVGCSGGRGMTVVDLETRQVAFSQRFGGLNIGHVRISRDGLFAHFPWMIYQQNPITAGNIRLGWVLASRLGRVRLDKATRREAISLDPRGQAVADPHGLDLTPDERYAVVSASGTHELLVYRLRELPWMDYGGPGDHIDPALLADRERFFRIPAGKRPMGLRIAPDGRTVYVADYLDNAIQVVDLEARAQVRRIALGGPEQPSLARQGEAIFYDARRSLDQWYSCHTCHYEGGTNAEAMDTLNDGSSFSFKTVLPLYDVAETGPWTWHGWQTDLRAAIEKSLRDTMLGPAPTADDVEAVVAFLSTLRRPPNPHRSHRNPDGSLSPAAERGRQIFESEQAACTVCHHGPHFTDGQIHDVGLGSRGDRYRGFNTPSLLGVGQKVRLLHDGRARSLDELLIGPHAPEKVAGSRPLSDDERRDLIEYLKSL